MSLNNEDFTEFMPIEDEITESSFTNKIYPTEGIDIFITKHFLQRWNQRLENRSPKHLNQSIEDKKLRYMCRGIDNSFHFLYLDQYNEFFIIIVGINGALQTIIPENYYRHHCNAVNLSSHIDSFKDIDDNDSSEEIEPIINTSQPVMTVNEKEYMDKIAKDTIIINQLNDRINELETIIETNESNHNRKIESMKKQIDKAIKHEDEVIVHVLSKNPLQPPLISNPECIIYTLFAVSIIQILWKLF